MVASDRALALSPDDAANWNCKGRALYGLGRLSEALAAYDRALALDPYLAAAWYNRAIALRGLGRNDDTQEAERRVKDLGG